MSYHAILRLHKGIYSEKNGEKTRRYRGKKETIPKTVLEWLLYT